MAKFTYCNIIEAIENDDTINIIGKIDSKFLNSQTIESLYYIFPLIERIVLEIYKQIPDADVEHYEQGIMKTLLSIIDNNSKTEIIPENTIKILRKYYEDNCLRNKTFHANKDIITIEVSFEELNFVIMQLLSILNRQIKNNQNYDFKDIEYL